MATSFIGVDFGGPGTTTDVHVAVDVGFGANGSWYDDSTGIEATISEAATVPEPGSIVLMASGLLGITGVVARRRRIAA